MAVELFSSLRRLVRPDDEVRTDDWVFRLHYRATVAILLASSGVGVAKQYFGDPINCQVRKRC